MSEAERKSEHTPVSYTSEELIGAARFCFADPKYHNCFGCPLEHKPCDNLERLLANRLELCEFALCAQEQNEPLTLRGYDIERLELVAELMKQRQITPDDLKKCVGNFAHALKMVMEVVEKQTAEALQAVSDASEPTHAPEKGTDHE